MVILYRHGFEIIEVEGEYILYNTRKTFRNGHTHLKSFNACVSIIKLIERKQLPKNRSEYFLKSILRVCNDKKYSERISDLIINYKELMEDVR